MNVKKQPELPEAVKKWLASPTYQQLKAAQEKYNLLVQSGKGNVQANIK